MPPILLSANWNTSLVVIRLFTEIRYANVSKHSVRIQESSDTPDMDPETRLMLFPAFKAVSTNKVPCSPGEGT